MLQAKARRRMVRTRHRRTPHGHGPGELLPSPEAARIVPRGQGFVLEYLGVADHVLVVRQHDTLASAKAQALADLGILEEDWH